MQSHLGRTPLLTQNQNQSYNYQLTARCSSVIQQNRLRLAFAWAEDKRELALVRQPLRQDGIGGCGAAGEALDEL